MNPFQRPYVEEIAAQAAAALSLPLDCVAAAVELPRDLSLGDFALPCFRFAKEKRLPPASLASQVAAAFHPTRYLASAQAVGPFVNFRLVPPARAERALRAIHEQGLAFGGEKPGTGKRIVIDYSSPNIAKPFHIGHLRSTVIGNALANLFELLGYEIVRVNHLGDWGTQFGYLMAAWQREEWRAEADAAESEPIRRLFRLYVRGNQEDEHGNPALADEARSWFRRLETGDPKAVALWKSFKEISLSYFDKIYTRLGVRFDHTTGESFFEDKMAPLVEKARASGVAEESEGAFVIHTNEDGPPLILLKKDGGTTYATRDLAAALYRHDEYAFEQNLYVVGSTQQLHFQQLFAALALLGFEWAGRCHHIAFGKILGLSTRKGNVIWLEEVLDEAVERAREKAKENPELVEDIEGTAERVGIGAVVFHDFLARRIKDLEFSWEAVLNFQGDSGPYVQFSHVRTCGILRKAGSSASPDSERACATPDVDFSLLSLPEDRCLVALLEAWPEKLIIAAEEYEPFVVARYLLELSGLFHSYLEKHRVLSDDKSLTAARLLLVDSVRRILAGGLELLGVQAPDRM
ncbi:MAG: arginine--tRNA ligase [Planctomycetes bacterium]|nr:arginine--tRNA ligase [Planctomycetota bacterium]